MLQHKYINMKNTQKGNRGVLKQSHPFHRWLLRFLPRLFPIYIPFYFILFSCWCSSSWLYHILSLPFVTCCCLCFTVATAALLQFAIDGVKVVCFCNIVASFSLFLSLDSVVPQLLFFLHCCFVLVLPLLIKQPK